MRGAKSGHSSDITDYVKTTHWSQHKWEHFDILASCKTDFHCKIKETLFIQELKPSLNATVSCEKLLFYQLLLLMVSRQINVLLLSRFQTSHFYDIYLVFKKLEWSLLKMYVD